MSARLHALALQRHAEHNEFLALSQLGPQGRNPPRPCRDPAPRFQTPPLGTASSDHRAPARCPVIRTKTRNSPARVSGSRRLKSPGNRGMNRRKDRRKESFLLGEAFGPMRPLFRALLRMPAKQAPYRPEPRLTGRLSDRRNPGADGGASLRHTRISPTSRQLRATSPPW